MRVTSEEIRSATFEYGLKPSLLEERFEATFVGYDWIDPDEADLIDRFFCNRRVIAFPFGQCHHPTIVSEVIMNFDDVISQISIPPCGNFIIFDFDERLLILNNARNLYVYSGPLLEVSQVFPLVSLEQDVETRYNSKEGDFQVQFPYTRKFYENYRGLHQRSREVIFS